MAAQNSTALQEVRCSVLNCQEEYQRLVKTKTERNFGAYPVETKNESRESSNRTTEIRQLPLPPRCPRRGKAPGERGHLPPQRRCPLV